MGLTLYFELNTIFYAQTFYSGSINKARCTF